MLRFSGWAQNKKPGQGPLPGRAIVDTANNSFAVFNLGHKHKETIGPVIFIWRHDRLYKLVDRGQHPGLRSRFYHHRA